MLYTSDNDRLHWYFLQLTCVKALKSLYVLFECAVLSVELAVHGGVYRGQTPADAEYNYLEHAKRLDMYGAHLYSAQLKVS